MRLQRTTFDRGPTGPEPHKFQIFLARITMKITMKRNPVGLNSTVVGMRDIPLLGVACLETDFGGSNLETEK